MKHIVQSVLAMLVMVANVAQAQEPNQLSVQIEKMTALIAAAFPLGAVTDGALSTSPSWPITTNLDKLGPDQLACVRSQVSSTAIRRKLLYRVQAYASSDGERLTRHLKALEAGATVPYRDLLLASIDADFDIATIRKADSKGTAAQHAAKVASLDFAEEHYALQWVFGIRDLFLVTQSEEVRIDRVRKEARYLADKLVYDALWLCNVRPDSILSELWYPEFRTAIEFDRNCANPTLRAPVGEMAAREVRGGADPAFPIVVPPYPPAALRRHEEGTVLVNVFVVDTGETARANIARSSGSAWLDKTALEAARDWRFLPPMLDGKATCRWGSVPIDFKIKDAR